MTTDEQQGNHYRGRFAPSPTGPLHFGSLIAALGFLGQEPPAALTCATPDEILQWALETWTDAAGDVEPT